MVSVYKEKCIGCYTCVIACKMEHNLPLNITNKCSKNENPSLIRILPVGPEFKNGKVYQKFVPILCLHCRNASCVQACPVNAISRDTIGIVHIDASKCTGCRLCFYACPCNAPQFDSSGKMRICDLCLHRLSEEKKTACEAHCPTKCIRIHMPIKMRAKVKHCMKPLKD
ncbi:MAG: 4Fe-4S dicluster domain-containing protein [Candidatus Bathyarchaeia archaeon]